MVHRCGVGDEVAGGSPEGLVESFGAYGIRRQPAPKEVYQRSQAGQGAGGESGASESCASCGCLPGPPGVQWRREGACGAWARGEHRRL